MSQSADVVVVGAGIAGLSTALHLARAGASVLVLERQAPWREASGVNAGTLALQNKPLPLAGFYIGAIAEWAGFAESLAADIGYVRDGGFRAATSAADEAALRDEAAAQARLGIATEWLEGQALRAAAPWLGPEVTAATFCAADGYASPLLTGRALLAALARAGGRILPQLVIRSQERAAGRYRLATSAGPIEAPRVVIAAGPWSAAVARLFGVGLALETRTIMLSVTQRIPPFMARRVVTHVSGRLTVKQHGNGTCILGGGFDGIGDIDSGQKELDLRQLRDNLRFHQRVIPRLGQAQLVRSWAGHVTDPGDQRPAMGPVPGRDGLYLAVSTDAGFSGGPFLGRLVSETVLGGALPADAATFASRAFKLLEEEPPPAPPLTSTTIPQNGENYR